jgi:hypothetical protein
LHGAFSGNAAFRRRAKPDTAAADPSGFEAEGAGDCLSDVFPAHAGMNLARDDDLASR